VNAPFAYYGGKTTLAERIASLLPSHAHYVEPFAGSLAVLLAKAPARMETVNDLDGNLMTFWRILREHPDELMRLCALTPHSRAEHQAAYDLDSAPTDLERARRVWVALTQGRGNTLRRTGWRYFEDPGRRGPMAMPGYLDAYVGRMPAAAERLANVSLECRPALDVITAYGQHDEVLIYADPPYLGTVRSSRQYAVEMSHDEEHSIMLDALRSCRSAVVLSGYASALYDEDLVDWHRIEFAAFTGQANTNGRRTEVLWSNRPLGERHLFSDHGAVS